MRKITFVFAVLAFFVVAAYAGQSSSSAQSTDQSTPLARLQEGNDSIVMGDLVLTESEVEPVMMKLQQEGIEETAVHNHLLNENPRVL